MQEQASRVGGALSSVKLLTALFLLATAPVLCPYDMRGAVLSFTSHRATSLLVDREGVRVPMATAIGRTAPNRVHG